MRWQRSIRSLEWETRLSVGIKPLSQTPALVRRHHRLCVCLGSEPSASGQHRITKRCQALVSLGAGLPCGPLGRNGPRTAFARRVEARHTRAHARTHRLPSGFPPCCVPQQAGLFVKERGGLSRSLVQRRRVHNQISDFATGSAT